MHSTGSRNRECGLQKVILDLLSHVCAASPRWGESLMEVALWVSVRIQTLIESVLDVCPVCHLFLRDSEGRNKKKINKKCYWNACRLVRIVLSPMPMVF